LNNFIGKDEKTTGTTGNSVKIGKKSTLAGKSKSMFYENNILRFCIFDGHWTVTFQIKIIKT